MDRENVEKRRGVSGAFLKWIAIITMLIDHTAAVILEPLLPEIVSGMPDFSNPLMVTYMIMRSIGRIAFPIFCFLLVEGFFHTHNRIKYALRLGIFALISEIPFDIAFYKKLPANGHQNVFFTLFIGLLMMMAMQYLRDKVFPKMKKYVNVFAFVSQALILILAMFVAKLLNTDYQAFGIIAIAIMYILYFSKKYTCLIGGLYFFAYEITAAIAYIPIWFYNGTRGKQMKYLFYVFYPAHLLILYGIYRIFFA